MARKRRRTVIGTVLRAGLVGGILAGVVLPCRGSEQRRADSVDLDGRWQFALGEGSEAEQTRAGRQKLRWQAMGVPGNFPWAEADWRGELPESLPCVWVRRVFSVSEDQADRLAVLRWNHIDYGATAYINGREVGGNITIGPYQTFLPPGVLKAGGNRIVLRVNGPAMVPKAKSGYWLIPCGFSNASRRGLPGFQGHIWIDFATDAYMKWILALPDLDAGKVRIRVTPVAPRAVDGLTVTAAVRPWPEGDVVGRGSAPAAAAVADDPLGGEHYYVDVPMEDVRPWTYEQPNLYTAEVALHRGEQVLDTVTIRFGMRRIDVAEGNYKLNGKDLWLRGSNLLGEWNWDRVNGKEKQYLVDEARHLSMNAFRTHTLPPSPEWTDLADENGIMILAEFPVLYNNQNFKFTDQEYAIWHRNCITDAAGWMGRLWNHPAVVMWVLSNESHYDTEWETGAFHDFVTELDPTRPTMRTGTAAGTPENYDVHPIGNISSWTEEGRFLRDIPRWIRTAGDRTVSASEYMNAYAHGIRWTGRENKLADQLACAQLGMEHTEAMRRHRFDVILPFPYGGLTVVGSRGEPWKDDFARPASAVWHSALSGILTSLDLFDANYYSAQSVTTDLCLINDTWSDAAVHVELLLTRTSPQFLPQAKCLDEPLAKWDFDFQLQADSLVKVPVTWTVPAEEGNYYLTARTTGEALPEGGVISQRFIHAVDEATVPDDVGERTFVVLGSDERAESYFKWKRPGRNPMKTTTDTNDLRPGEHVVIIWNPTLLSAEEKAAAPRLCAFAEAGGRVVVVDAHQWDFDKLCDVDVKWVGKNWGASRAFPATARHPLLKGIDRQWLIRWNGLPGRVASKSIEGDVMERAEPILWSVSPQQVVAAEVPAASGSGKILFVQLPLRDKTAGGPDFDPVADRILVNILGLE